MASLGENFDASAQPDMDDFSPIPVGDYAMVVSDSQIKATKDLLGKFIELKVEDGVGPLLEPPCLYRCFCPK